MSSIRRGQVLHADMAFWAEFPSKGRELADVGKPWRQLGAMTRLARKLEPRLCFTICSVMQVLRGDLCDKLKTRPAAAMEHLVPVPWMVQNCCHRAPTSTFGS
jgi:hypothetical protein